MKTYLLTSVKDEGPFILEFVAHHRALGFWHLYIASNDCSDGTDDLLDALAQAGHVTHLRNPALPGDLPQREAYRRLRQSHGIDAADWVMILDVDEFLNIHVGDRSLSALVAAVPGDVDIVALNAATFGSDGHSTWTDEPVTSRFCHRLPDTHKTSGAVKSLFRNPAHYGAFHNHSPVNYLGSKPTLTVLRGNGTTFQTDPAEPLWRQLRQFRARDVGYEIAQYNHYAVKTSDSFRLRQARGRGAAPLGAVNDRHDQAYFDTIAVAAQRDDTIRPYAAATVALMGEMLADPKVQAAQAETVRRYAARIAALVS